APLGVPRTVCLPAGDRPPLRFPRRETRPLGDPEADPFGNATASLPLNPRFPLTPPGHHASFAAPRPAHQTFPNSTMARICTIRGSRVRSGGKINRSGLAKKKGGIGRHVTKVV